MTPAGALAPNGRIPAIGVRDDAARLHGRTLAFGADKFFDEMVHRPMYLARVDQRRRPGNRQELI